MQFIRRRLHMQRDCRRLTSCDIKGTNMLVIFNYKKVA